LQLVALLGAGQGRADMLARNLQEALERGMIG